MGLGAHGCSTPTTRYSTLPSLIVWPTLFSPPNTFSFVSWFNTTTGCGPSSAAASQPWPYWNGTSNIGKNSCDVTRNWALNGLTPLRAGSSSAPDLYMITLRGAALEPCKNMASRYVSSCGGRSGFSSSYGRSALHVSSVTA